jgi:hypothetical protein
MKASKNFDNVIESYSTIGVPKIFPVVAESLGYMHSCSTRILQR